MSVSHDCDLITTITWPGAGCHSKSNWYHILSGIIEQEECESPVWAFWDYKKKTDKNYYYIKMWRISQISEHNKHGDGRWW